MEKTFEEWYDAFCEFVRGFGYHGFLDKDSFLEDYNDGIDAYWLAKKVVERLKSH